jgi:pimeloyl-ACP methyl ester carboxylesterase
MATAETRPTSTDPADTGRSPRTVTLDDGRTVAYTEYGASDGTPVVFLHGTPGSRLLGEVFDGPASERGYRVLALDRPGYGRSTPWPSRTPADAAEYVGAVLADAGVSRAGVIGFSGGAIHALALAATSPDLVTSVDVVAGPAPPAASDATPRFQRVLGVLANSVPPVVRAGYGLNALFAERSATPVVTQYTSPDGPPVSDEAAELVRSDFCEGFRETTAGAVTETRLFSGDWGFSVENVERPVRLWYGRRDANAPLTAAHELDDRLPESDLTVDDEADHLTTLLRNADAVLAAHSTGSNR